MKKRVLISLALVIGLSFMFTIPALACEPPLVDCSPGYYKNHTEEWFGVCCVAGVNCEPLLAALKAKGPGSEEIRREAQDYLNQCFEDKGYIPCEDD